MVQLRQEEILAAAAPFFAEAGYRQADLQVLADRLGIGKGTIYRYFPSKEALFFATVDSGISRLVNCVDEALKGEEDIVQYIRKGVETYLDFFDRNPALIELLIIERAEFKDRKEATYFVYKERYHKRREAFVEEAIRKGVLRPISAERIVRVIGDALYGVIFTNHFSKRKVCCKDQAEAILDVVLHGILAKE